MNGKLFSKVFGFAAIMLLSANLYSQAIDAPNAIDNCNVILGAGFVYHGYSEVDDFREATGLLKDEIKFAMGAQFYAELLLNNTLDLSLPVGLAVGYRYQALEGAYKYSSSLGYTAERKAQLFNNIAYVNVLLPLDNEKYWLLGCSAGVGASTYKYAEEYSAVYSNYKATSKGTVVPLSVFLDWGADGIGARFGYSYIMSKYPDVDGVTPKGSGNQFFLDLRYAI